MTGANLLRGERVRLAAVGEEDVATVAGWYEDAAFLRLYDSAPAYPKTAGQLRRQIKEQQEGKESYLFAIHRLEDDALVGLLGFDGIAWSHGTAFVSIAIGAAQYRGQGYGREAMQLGVRFAFNELNLHRLCLTVFAYNETAIALYEGLGFTREGVFREHLLRDGRRHDMYLYGLLRREWEESGP
jgi:RimJ/RimL family protein N-acetyltransferase